MIGYTYNLMLHPIVLERAFFILDEELKDEAYSNYKRWPAWVMLFMITRSFKGEDEFVSHLIEEIARCLRNGDEDDILKGFDKVNTFIMFRVISLRSLTELIIKNLGYMEGSKVMSRSYYTQTLAFLFFVIVFYHLRIGKQRTFTDDKITEERYGFILPQ